MAGDVLRCLGKFARWFPQVVPGAASEITMARHKKGAPATAGHAGFATPFTTITGGARRSRGPSVIVSSIVRFSTHTRLTPPSRLLCFSGPPLRTCGRMSLHPQLSPDRSRALSRADIEQLLTRQDISLRERTLWHAVRDRRALGRGALPRRWGPGPRQLPREGTTQKAAQSTSPSGRPARPGYSRAC